MKIVTVTMVRNEQDILESFVRYHSPLVDLMIILDNGSCDRTSEILMSLRADGKKIVSLFDADPAYLQAEKVTRMVRSAFLDHGADIVMPMDADEFVARSSGPIKRQDLETLLGSEPTYIEWITYVPSQVDNTAELNPIIRIKQRRATQHNHDSKVVIPRSVFDAILDLSVSQGSHYLLNGDGESVRRQDPSPELFYLHFPIRSANHMRAKHLVGWIANLARPERVLFDWLPSYNLAKQRCPTMGEVRDAALHYNVLDKSTKIDLDLAPVNLEHVNNHLRTSYTVDEETDVLKAVLNLAEDLADVVSLGLGRVPLGDTSISDIDVYERISAYRSIEGWLSYREANLLYRVAASLAPNSPNVVEIGSWMGRSAYVLAKALKDHNSGGRLYCIDPLDGRGDSSSEALYSKRIESLPDCLEAQFWKNMKEHCVEQFVRLICCSSGQALSKIPETIDFLFIDGDHSIEAVREDFRTFAPRVPVGGYIGFHDVGSTQFVGPKAAVDQLVTPSAQWSTHTLVDELYVARRVK